MRTVKTFVGKLLKFSLNIRIIIVKMIVILSTQILKVAEFVLLSF